MAAGLPEQNWKEVYANLKTFHDKAYTVIDAAIKLEQEGKKDEALRRYEEGLGLIDLALELRVECPSNPDITWEKGCVMLQKMRKSRKELLGRIADIQVSQPLDPNLLPPPSYDEAMSLTPTTGVPPTTPVLAMNGDGPISLGAGASSQPMSYQQLGEALNNLKVETEMQSAQVIYTHENVQLYFISTDGVVSSSSQPSVLRILQLEDGTDNDPVFYLQVGDWFYPLVPNVSPCFRSEFGAFILPDVHGEDAMLILDKSILTGSNRFPGSAVGIMLPPEADKSVYNLLEDILHCIVTTEPMPPPRSSRVKRDETRSAAVSRSIVSDKRHHKKKSHRKERSSEDGEEKKKHSRRHRRHRRHRDHDDDQDGTDSVVSSKDEYHKRHHKSKKHHGYDLIHKPKHRTSKHLHYGLPVFGSYRTVLGVKPSEAVQVPEEKPQKILGTQSEDDEDDSSSEESDSDDSVEEGEELVEKSGVKRKEKEADKKSESGSSDHGRHRQKRFIFKRSRDSGAQYISNGLVRGAERASQYINSSTPRLLEKITPDPTPRQVPPKIARGAEMARNATGTAVVVTGYVANKVGTATMALGRYLAPHIQKHGTNLLSSAGGIDEKAASEKMEGVLTVAAGAVEGFSTVYTGLEQSASILGNSLTNNTVHVVEHKYGQPMGTVTGHTLHSIGNAFAATQNVRFLTPKGLAKRTAKDAGKAFVEDFRAELRNHQQQTNGEKPPLDKPGPSKS